MFEYLFWGWVLCAVRRIGKGNREIGDRLFFTLKCDSFLFLLVFGLGWDIERSFDVSDDL